MIKKHVFTWTDFCLIQSRFRILFGAAFHFGIPGWKKEKQILKLKIDLLLVEGLDSEYTVYS
jgi:hypothetical protein